MSASQEPENTVNSELSPEERVVIDAMRSGREFTEEIPPYLDVDPYENCIAFYIVGKMILEGCLRFDSDDWSESGSHNLPYVVRMVAEGILEGVKAYGYDGNIREMVNHADLGRM